MQNLNIIPVSATVGAIDDIDVLMGYPPYIIAEGKMVAFYTANSTVGGFSIAVATCPTRTDYPLLDVDSKSVGTYQKSPKNQFNKDGAVIVKGGILDTVSAKYPAAIYNAREKKFMVYYIGEQPGGTYHILLATGPSYDALAKHTLSGVQVEVVTEPAGSTISLVPPIALFDKEENLYKLYYTCVVGGLDSVYLATSKNGYDF